MGLTLHPAYTLFATSSFTYQFGHGLHLEQDMYSYCSDITMAMIFLVLFGPSWIEGLFIR